MSADTRGHTAIWRGGASRAVFLVLGRACAFGSSILIIRMLPRSGSGAFLLLISVASLLGVLLALGLPEGISRFSASADAEGRHEAAEGMARTALRATAGISGVALAITTLVVAVFRPGDWLVVVATGLAGIFALQAVSGAFLRTRGRVLAAELWIGLVPPVFLVAVAWVAVAVPVPETGLVVWIRVAIEVVACLLLVGAAIRTAKAPRRPIKPVIVSVLPLWMTVLCWLAIKQADVILLGAIRGPADVAIYVPVLRTVELCVIAFGLFGSYVMPAAARLHAQGVTHELSQLYATVSKVAYAIATPVLIGMLVAPATIIGTLFDIHDPVVVPTARVLALAYWINAFLGFNGVVLEATGRLRTLAGRSIAALIVTIGASLLLIPRFGIIGGAIGTFVGLTTLNVMNSLLLWKAKRIHPFDRGVLLTVAASVACGVGVLVLGGTDAAFGVLIVALVVAGLLTSAVAWLSTAEPTRAGILGAFRTAQARS